MNLYILVNWHPYCLSQSSLTIEPHGHVWPQLFDSDQVYFTVNRTIEWYFSFLFVSEDSIQRGYKLSSRLLLDSSSSCNYPPSQDRSTTYLSLSSSPSMDAFTYFIDLFTFASDDEDLPTNEEDPRSSGSANGPPGCVIAWDASFPSAYWWPLRLFKHHSTSSFMLCSNLLAYVWVSQEHSQWCQQLSLSRTTFTQRTFLLVFVNHILEHPSESFNCHPQAQASFSYHLQFALFPIQTKNWQVQ